MKLLVPALVCVLALSGKCDNKQSSELPPPDVNTPEIVDPEPAPSPVSLRLATYNVGVFGKSGTNTTDMVAAMMKELEVNALSMNELDSCNTRNTDFQIKRFAEAMGGWDYTFSQALNYKGGGYGIGVVSDPSLGLLKRYRLKLDKGDGSEQRALAVCEYKDFVFCSTHLDHKSKDAQRAQAAQITDWIGSAYGKSDKPVILCGDFNALPESETIEYMKREWTILSPQEPTYPASGATKCIDYIMVYRNAAPRVKLQGSGIPVTFKSGDVKTASDHLPVYVDITIE